MVIFVLYHSCSCATKCSCLFLKVLSQYFIVTIQRLLIFCDKFGILKQPSSSSPTLFERSIIFALIKVSTIPLSSLSK